MRARLSIVAIAIVLAAGCLGPSAPTQEKEELPSLLSYGPHVIVGVPDTGINPYHSMYYRPNLTQHPCTYIMDFPCDLTALNLTVGGSDYDAALEADKAVWDSIKKGKWYWIPKTAFVAVSCDANLPVQNLECILDDHHPHGTGTTSSVLSENPDALIAFKEGGPQIDAFLKAKIPVDIFSVSWGFTAPLPVPSALREATGTGFTLTPLYVKASGNTPWSSLTDTWSGIPQILSVGGAYASSQSEEAAATKQPEIVSYYCRPTAKDKTVDEMRERYCGTSFAAPTAAGGISKVVLALRRQSGYNGSIVNDQVDPILKVSLGDLRTAINLTASYDPKSQYDTPGSFPVPKNPAAPWVQWGWGFYDGTVANDTIAHMLKVKEAPAKPAACNEYMSAQFAVKRLLYA